MCGANTNFLICSNAICCFDRKDKNSNRRTLRNTCKRQYFNYFKDRLIHFDGTVVNHNKKENRMKHFMVLFLFTAIANVNIVAANNIVRVTICDSIPQETKSCMEAQITTILSLMNNTTDEAKEQIDFNGINISNGVKNTFNMLWEYFSIRTIDEEIVEHCLTLETKEGFLGYSVRGIDIQLYPRQFFSGDSLQKLSFYLNAKGEITDVCLSVDSNQYCEVTKEAVSHDDMLQCMTMLYFCEKLRTAYHAKDIEFIRKTINDKCIFNNGKLYSFPNESPIIRRDPHHADYPQLLNKVFMRSGIPNMTIGEILIERHPLNCHWYGLRIKQNWNTDRYHDTNYFFSLWDFSVPQKPIIHYNVIQTEDIPEEDRISLRKLELPF